MIVRRFLLLMESIHTHQLIAKDKELESAASDNLKESKASNEESIASDKDSKASNKKSEKKCQPRYPIASSKQEAGSEKMTATMQDLRRNNTALNWHPVVKDTDKEMELFREMDKENLQYWKATFSSKAKVGGLKEKVE